MFSCALVIWVYLCFVCLEFGWFVLIILFCFDCGLLFTW